MCDTVVMLNEVVARQQLIELDSAGLDVRSSHIDIVSQDKRICGRRQLVQHVSEFDKEVG